MFKRVIALVLSALMIVSVISVTATAEEKTVKQPITSTLNFGYDDDEMLRAIIVYDGESDIALNQKGSYPAIKTAKKLNSDNRKRLTGVITDSYGAKLVYNYGTLINGIAVDASYGELKKIEKL